jgi:hypothetical protein
MMSGNNEDELIHSSGNLMFCNIEDESTVAVRHVPTVIYATYRNLYTNLNRLNVRLNWH